MVKKKAPFHHNSRMHTFAVSIVKNYVVKDITVAASPPPPQPRPFSWLEKLGSMEILAKQIPILRPFRKLSFWVAWKEIEK